MGSVGLNVGINTCMKSDDNDNLDFAAEARKTKTIVRRFESSESTVFLKRRGEMSERGVES